MLHHNTNPSWYDEIKLLLPVCITPSHHLLFTFYHISIQGSKKRDSGIEIPVGYAWIPLLVKNRQVLYLFQTIKIYTWKKWFL